MFQPQLKIVNLDSRHSSEPSVTPTKATRPRRSCTSTVIEISDDEPSLESKTPVFEKLKPLKYDKYFGKLEIINDDPKFFSKIPYTRLQLCTVERKDLKEKWAKNNDKSEESSEDAQPPKRNMFFKIKLKSSHNNRYKIVKSQPSISKSKSKSSSFYSEEEELKRHNIIQSLSINIQKKIDLSDIGSVTDETEHNGVVAESDHIESIQPNEDESVHEEKQPVLQEESQRDNEALHEREEDKVSSKSDSEVASTEESEFTEEKLETENKSANKHNCGKESVITEVNSAPMSKKFKTKPLSRSKNDLQKDGEREYMNRDIYRRDNRGNLLLYSTTKN